MIKERILLVTSGGDAPGMNVFLATSIKKFSKKYDVYLSFNGLIGLINNDIQSVDKNVDYDQYLHQPSTFLGSSRLKIWLQDDEYTLRKIVNNLQQNEIKHLIVLGGNGSLAATNVIANAAKINAYGIPFSIDNDFHPKYYTLGASSAATFNNQLLKNLIYTNKAHQAICFVEIMGRDHDYLVKESIKNLNPLLVISKQNEKLTGQQIADIIAYKIDNNEEFDPLIVVKELIYTSNEYNDINKILANIFITKTIRKPQIFSYLQRGCNVNQLDYTIALQASSTLFDFITRKTDLTNLYFLGIDQDNPNQMQFYLFENK
ncbi:6-phosphofructokinase [Ureaplasma sp. ES3154-GEN]|uniref:6-phosphofructokinase n=1 Tax=Ureaplasma sp. ES3154-GEN TaxID=2984844 RepID=UPI0021E7E830|nr:6-phosphofructokinase [Ureaplasma sp. ES3154-GEN]MCV3743684.1 6-phosphofructokinase [Ureaplasma sp. ES3154-GEN]